MQSKQKSMQHGAMLQAHRRLRDTSSQGRQTARERKGLLNKPRTGHWLLRKKRRDSCFLGQILTGKAIPVAQLQKLPRVRQRKLAKSQHPLEERYCQRGLRQPVQGEFGGFGRVSATLPQLVWEKSVYVRNFGAWAGSRALARVSANVGPWTREGRAVGL